MELRNGLWVKLDTGAVPGSIQGVLSVALDGGCVPVGERTIEISPNEDSGHPHLYLLGGWLPRIGATNFRAILHGTEVTDMAWRFYARLANDPRAPLPMEALGAGFTDFSPSSGVVNVNTGNVSVTGLTSFSSYHMIQFILALKMKSGGANPTGFFKT